MTIIATKYEGHFEHDVDSWAGNTAFGTRDLPTSVAVQTARVFDGVQALRTTWAAAGANPQWVGRLVSGLTIGNTYTFIAKVYIPTGAGTIRPEILFYYAGANITQRDQWVTIAYTFVAQATGHYCGFENTAPTAATVLDVDKAFLYEGTLVDYLTDTGQPITNKTDVLRLEIQDDPTGLTNSVENPNGDLGAWFWITPIANTKITALTNPTQLQFYTGATQACNFTTIFMPIVAGQWVAASLNMLAVSGSHGIRIRFEWYDSNHTLLSSSTQGAFQGTTGVIQYTPIQAPGSTAYMKFRVDFYKTSLTNPDALSSVNFNNVTVAVAATSGALGASRTNICTNPSLETNSTGYASSNSLYSTVARSTAAAAVGTASLAITKNSTAGPSAGAQFTGIPITGGKTYAFSAAFKAAATARNIDFTATYRDNHGVLVATFDWGSSDTTSGWTTIGGTLLAPVNAQTVDLFFVASASSGNMTTNEVHYVDTVLVEQATSLGAYFDGSTAAGGGWTYSWNGTANNSTSTAFNSSLSYIEPVTYINVIGSGISAHISRESISPGILEATLIGATIDPATSTLIRPGRKCRLMALDYTGVWQPLITAKVDTGDVIYDLSRTDQDNAIVSLVATDNVNQLAQVSQPYGVNDLVSFPGLMESAGVPYKINKWSNQVAITSYDTKNDDAGLLDQIILSRDSNMGYAWVDRTNAINLTDGNPLHTDDNLLLNDGGSDYYTFKRIADTSKFAVVSNCTLALYLSVFLQVNVTAAGNAVFETVPTNIEPGQPYTASFMAAFATGADRTIWAQVYWLTQAGALISTDTNQVFVENTNKNTNQDWHQWTTGTAPANAYSAKIRFTVVSAGAGEQHLFEGIVLSAPRSVLDETDYSSATAGFSMADCINSVLITLRTYNGTTNETDETAYGPYEDSTSIATWGRHQSTFVLNTSVINSPNPQQFAGYILAKNAQPQQQIRDMEIKIGDASRISRGMALLDLYDQVNAVNNPKGINQMLRISSIEHTIDFDVWTMRLGFVNPESVAIPLQTPASATANYTDGTWIPLTLANGWNQVSGYSTAAYMKKNGIIYIKGVIKNTVGNVFIVAAGGLAVGCRPAERRIFNPVTSNVAGTYILGRVDVLTDGSIAYQAGGFSILFSLDGINFPAEA